MRVARGRAHEAQDERAARDHALAAREVDAREALEDGGLEGGQRGDFKTLGARAARRARSRTLPLLWLPMTAIVGRSTTELIAMPGREARTSRTRSIASRIGRTDVSKAALRVAMVLGAGGRRRLGAREEAARGW